MLPKFEGSSVTTKIQNTQVLESDVKGIGNLFKNEAIPQLLPFCRCS